VSGACEECNDVGGRVAQEFKKQDRGSKAGGRPEMSGACEER
jgi:hypothetical protein